MSESRCPALGRGLSALIPGASAARPASASLDDGPQTLPIGQIRAATNQPRTRFNESALEELTASVSANGILQPIVVRRVGDGDYVIIAGERRFRAATCAGLLDVPVVIREATDAEAFELALVENIQRQDLDPLEEAEAYRHLVSTYRMTQEQIARRVGKDRATVANSLRLLKLPAAVQNIMREGHLTAGHARALMTLPDDVDPAAFGRRAADEGWSVRETERRARAIRDGEVEAPVEEPTPAPTRPRTEPEERSLEDIQVEADLRGVLGAPVRLVNRQGVGRIEIRFHSLEELDRLLEMLSALEGV